MERIIIKIDFRGKVYEESKEYAPVKDRIIGKNYPPAIIEKLRRGEQQRTVNQETLMLNQITGRLGEKILNDFLTERGYKLSQIGSYKVFSDIGDMEAGKDQINWLIECKTSRNMSGGLRLRIKQLNRYARYKKLNNIGVIYFAVIIRLRRAYDYKNPLKIGDQAQIYEYYVKQIRNLTPYIKERKRKDIDGEKKQNICIMPHRLLRKNRRKVRTPEYFI